jgi:hypothetical protein
VARTAGDGRRDRDAEVDGGDRATATLDGWKSWLSANNAAVMAVLFFVFGVVLLSQGLGLLTV